MSIEELNKQIDDLILKRKELQEKELADKFKKESKKLKEMWFIQFCYLDDEQQSLPCIEKVLARKHTSKFVHDSQYEFIDPEVVNVTDSQLASFGCDLFDNREDAVNAIIKDYNLLFLKFDRFRERIEQIKSGIDFNSGDC